MSEADPYTYPGSTILRNKLGLTHAAQLDRLERRLVTQLAAEGIPAGGFDLAHLRTIHRHLFQDVYDWAGELRLAQLAVQAGHKLDFARLDPLGWLAASRATHGGDYAPMAAEIRRAFARRR